jgi:prepilin-type processing-associated H-X9-DG protein
VGSDISSTRLSWVTGWEDFTANNSANTNLKVLQDGLLWTYTKSPGIYKCPADKYLAKQRNVMMPRLRSLSMNAYLEGGGYGGSGKSTWYPDFLSYNRQADIIRPGPSDLFVFVDEHPDSINDGWPIIQPNSPSVWGNDLPASYHNGACGLSFADGHSEIKRWLEATTLARVTRVEHGTYPGTKPADRDIRWMVDHATAPVRQ